MKKSILSTLLVLSAAAVPAFADAAADFDALTRPYEAIRVALVNDHTDGVAERAAEIRDQAAKIAADAATPAEVKPLAEKISGHAGALAQASQLAGAREAFYEISKLLVQYRSKVGEADGLPVVVYCSMAKKSWLQPDANEIGNPYYGQAMAACGEVVGN